LELTVGVQQLGQRVDCHPLVRWQAAELYITCTSNV